MVAQSKPGSSLAMLQGIHKEFKPGSGLAMLQVSSLDRSSSKRTRGVPRAFEIALCFDSASISATRWYSSRA